MEQDNQENALDDLEGKWQRIAGIVGADKAPTIAELAYYDQQRELAATGQALNQCPHCGSYRIDGQPPVLHKPDCPTRPPAPPAPAADPDIWMTSASVKDES